MNTKRKLTSSQLIMAGFAFVILIGTLLLMLPFSTRGPERASFLEALFTSTSAVCVTGLIVQDTATYWTEFGQLVIIILIQIGGMGVITVASAFSIAAGKKIGLMQRNTMQEAISAQQVGGIVKLTSFILKMIFSIEALGAIAMSPVFIGKFGIIKGVWYSIFHSISAFCNAGFDLMGIENEFSSLTAFSGNIIINITIMLLILIGGIGFLTWDDFATNKLKWKKYRMQTKVVLTMSAILLIFPFIYFFYGEFNALPTKERILASAFQTITPRTAGFNTVDFNTISEVGIMVLIVLMLIGGSPGSTAGGMKLTTVAILFANMISIFKQKEDTNFFGRRIPEDAIKNTAAVVAMYMILFLTGSLIISRIENLPILTCFFEAGSAIATVGLTMGITPSLSVISKLILIILMYLGRVGGLTVVFATISGSQKNSGKLPQEKIMVG